METTRWVSNVLYERPTLEIGTRPDPHDEGAIPRPGESGDVVCLRCSNGFIEYVRVWGDGATTFDANDSPELSRVLPFALAGGTASYSCHYFSGSSPLPGPALVGRFVRRGPEHSGRS